MLLTKKNTLRVGTRCSRLALVQTNEVIQELQNLGIHCEIVPIKTTGDFILNKPLVDIGGKALFLKEIEESLLNNHIDIAVHSLKDVPAILPEGLIIPAVLKRCEPEDVLVAHYKLNELPHGAVIGTCSVRRKAFLKHLFGNKLNIVDLRGNIDTRVQKIKNEELDGIIVAKCGIQRLHLENYISEIISRDVILPAIGQGTIAIECHENNHDIVQILSLINHKKTFDCITAERSFMLEMQGNCHTPIAAFAKFEGNTLTLQGAFAIPTGEKIFYKTMNSNNDFYSLGTAVAKFIKSEIQNSMYFNDMKDFLNF